MDSQLIDSNKLYEAAVKPRRNLVRRMASFLWLVVGLAGLTAFAFAEPFSARILSELVAKEVIAASTASFFLPLWMLIRGVLIVEVVGYLYHRFFQHIGRLTRMARVFRRNQHYHWYHHMVIYPIGRLYRRAVKYVPAEKNGPIGISLGWGVPALIVMGLILWYHGLSLASLSFIAGMGLYAAFVIDTAHRRFHEVNHPWAKSYYFRWLEDIHILHHFDQRTNFTIVHPLMDMLFGTYLSPAHHQAELKVVVEDEELSVSDLINWRYLLLDATPAEYALFITRAQRHPRALRKIDKLVKVMRDRQQLHAGDAHAKLLETRALELIEACRTLRPPGNK